MSTHAAHALISVDDSKDSDLNSDDRWQGSDTVKGSEERDRTAAGSCSAGPMSMLSSISNWTSRVFAVVKKKLMLLCNRFQPEREPMMLPCNRVQPERVCIAGTFGYICPEYIRRFDQEEQQSELDPFANQGIYWSVKSMVATGTKTTTSSTKTSKSSSSDCKIYAQSTSLDC